MKYYFAALLRFRQGLLAEEIRRLQLQVKELGRKFDWLVVAFLEGSQL